MPKYVISCGGVCCVIPYLVCGMLGVVQVCPLVCSYTNTICSKQLTSCDDYIDGEVWRRAFIY